MCTRDSCERPVGALGDALRDMGVDIRTHHHCPPVTINAGGLAGGKITLRDIESSQYVSALLLCAPYTDRGIELSLEGGVVSAPYIDLTIAVMEDFGVTISKPERFAYRVNAGEPYRGRRYVVEGDASSASYFFLAAALLKTTIRVEGISRESRQGDIRLLDVLEKLGCRFRSTTNGVDVTGGTLLKGDRVFDFGDMPDMVPTLARVRRVMELLGDPQRSARVIHVTGTNGKTSTARMIETLVQATGLRVGTFTSPHLHSVTERIRIDGVPIAPERFVEVHEDVRPIIALSLIHISEPTRPY